MSSALDRLGPPAADFGRFVARVGGPRRLVVQPRMGMSVPSTMREGLLATRRAAAATAGTITLDSYTRMGQHHAARRALADGVALNGYPLVAHSPATTQEVLAGVLDADFQVQVRHGTADPQDIFRVMGKVGLNASEGGPVSYCLPYGRTPLAEAVTNWERSCELLAESSTRPHLETFGGCMMGQLCPPSLLIAISLLEGLFFVRHGVRSISLSYAQQTHPEQDAEAIHALRRLADELFAGIDWHVVLYTYMGMYPETAAGARLLLANAVQLAMRSGVERLIVKTEAESSRIPTIAENVAALEQADAVARTHREVARRPVDTGIYSEAAALVEAVRNLHPDVGRALVIAFRMGYLDVPFCLHPDNQGQARGALADDGRLVWARVGSMPIALDSTRREVQMTASGLLSSLSYVRRKFDHDALSALDGQLRSCPDQVDA
ncbi:glutamate mutase epsilon subunit [Saccharomonospora marina XMU15]|uniref:Glutamate mutase epsilon subunit n=1 Tax=Saccharomonospora marina XMU15 TaxID=882083 RepID=H5X7R5_9PSEU|nr:methylaspartate mutase [Saccharomonospora marina]EHR51358.1 glutamate mutase epsilon subunit [Saccharomonospora marina XMU15]